MRLHFVALLLVALPLATRAADAPATPARPNILLILADDLGFSDLGCYGSEIPTPHLDRLAANGVRFTQFYNTGRCCPSRASLLTGLYPHQAGVGAMIDPYAKSARDQLNSPAYTDHLSPRTPTIAEALRPVGYRTGMCGKWHLGYRPEEWPARRGFDRSLVQIDGAMNYYGVGIQHTPGQVPPMAQDDQPFTPPPGFFSTDAYTDRAAQFITDAAAEKKPFFLYLSYNAPHWPLHAPAEDVAHFKGQYSAGWESVRKARHQRQVALGLVDEAWGMAPPDRGVQKPWNELTQSQRDEWDLRMAVYAAQVERMDRNIGRILDTLRALDLLDNTLIVFLSDNGGAAEDPRKSAPNAVTGTPESYVGYARPWATVSNTPFRLHKQRAHEGGIAAPAIVHWPNHLKSPGQLIRQPAHLIDLMPTFLQAANAPHPTGKDNLPTPKLEGRSLLPLLTQNQPLPDRPLFFEHEGHRAVRSGDFKLVAVHNQPWELYNLQSDRTESHNLAPTHPEKVRDLESLYTAWTKRIGVLPYPTPQPKK
jgi:arylsulfatase